jgi:hypothetical protein
MSLQGFQNYTQPLVLNGFTTINGDLNAKNVYVSGVITGAGISTNILNTDNIWTGTNDFQNTTTYTGVAVAGANDLKQKAQVDQEVGLYNPLGTNNVWQTVPTFSNATPPIIAVSTSNANNLFTSQATSDYIITFPSTLLSTQNSFSGSNTFSGSFTGVSTPQLEVPTIINQATSKAYVDGKIEVAGKTLTFVLTTAGTFNFANFNRANIAKCDFWLFSGSCGGSSGSVVSGTIGNGCGLNGSLILNVGTVANPATVYTTQDKTLPSSTSFTVSNVVIGCAGGACNLNGAIVVGNVIAPDYGGVNGLSCAGSNTTNNKLAYGNVLGTSTSGGGAIFVAYYI